MKYIDWIFKLIKTISEKIKEQYPVHSGDLISCCTEVPLKAIGPYDKYKIMSENRDKLKNHISIGDPKNFVAVPTHILDKGDTIMQSLVEEFDITTITTAFDDLFQLIEETDVEILDKENK